MLHRSTALEPISAAVGHGVVATKLIPRGTVVWVRDPLDRTIDPAWVETLHPLLRAAVANHGFFDRDGMIVLCWDHARYINHSCEPNCLSPGYDFEVATRDIHPGEQLTNDYATLNLACEFECRCGAPSCRKHVSGSTALHERMVPHWDALVTEVIPFVERVEQPLWTLIDPEERADFEEVVAGRRALRTSAWHLREPLHMPR